MSTYEKTSFNKMHREKKFIKELVKYETDINKVNNIGNTPLHNYVSQYDITLIPHPQPIKKMEIKALY
ncbi:HSPV201b [Horsepox virus]|uniref:HSPV201b n=1 Tax=Horsepox virus TaxID=397342 RepID=Q0GNM6_HSPV|nr:HSPV201b [Horsepox virus]AUD55371.1 HSPV201b [Horsepox virus]DAD53575.1 TPA_asm: truncated ankyrin-like protein [Horsepox virus]